MNSIGNPTRTAVISGWGVSCPLGRSVPELESRLLAGDSSLEPVRGFDTSALTSSIAATFPPGTEYRAPQSWKSVVDKASLSAFEAFQEAWSDSGIATRTPPSRRIAVVVGSSHAGIESTEAVYLKSIGRLPGPLDQREVFSILTSSVANLISTHLGATGPRWTISSACASSNTAMGIGFDLVSSDQADCAVVVGTDSVSLAIMAGFNALRALSPQKTAPFSLPAGLNLGEGAGVVIIEPSQALVAAGNVPRAVLHGYGLSSDAYHITAPDVTGDGARRAMEEALRDAGIASSEVDYVSAHGTGTDANDKAESLATARVFPHRPPVSSSKSILGHTLGASGIIETIISLLFAQQGLVPPTLNYQGTREGCADLDYVPNSPSQASVETICCNNFGFGGNNSSLIVSRSGRLLRPRTLPDRRVVVVATGAVTVHGPENSDLDRAFAANSGPIAIPGRVAPLRFTSGNLSPFARSAPMIKFGLKAAASALEGHPCFSRNPRYGLLGGMLNGSSHSIAKYFESVFQDGPGLASAQHFPMTTVNATAGQTAIALGITGYTSTFCGSQSAFAYGRDLIRRGRQDGVLVVASDDLHEAALGIYESLGLKEPWSEGGAALALEAQDTAQLRGAQILGEVAGLAVGSAPGLFGGPKSGTVLAALAREALDEAGLELESIATVVFTDCKLNRMGANSRAAMAQLFSPAPERISSVPLLGYAPAATPFWNIQLALRHLSPGSPVLVLDTDLSGNLFALILTAPENPS